jgi:hypothetical protein
VGAAVRLRILLSRTSDCVSLEGRVKWVNRHPSENGYQMGVEFFHDTPQGFMTLIKELFEAQGTSAPTRPDPAALNRNESF